MFGDTNYAYNYFSLSSQDASMFHGSIQDNTNRKYIQCSGLQVLKTVGVN